MVKIKEENGQFVVYVRGAVTAIFPTKTEAETFAVKQTQYPTQEETLIADNQEDVPNGIRD
ncbi:hypothetical protein ACLI5Y_17100 [Enterococcus innesii]|uniref:hypothetical protein n=1 Tax=Enterococcus innesii TaxID=2839759 RepID=UPI003984917D